jgi:hypothetical protein
MTPSPGRGNRQRDLLPRSKDSLIPIEQNHRLVRIADTLDWTEMEERAQKVRAKKRKNGAGRRPHLRALLGTMVPRQDPHSCDVRPTGYCDVWETTLYPILTSLVSLLRDQPEALGGPARRVHASFFFFEGG